MPRIPARTQTETTRAATSADVATASPPTVRPAAVIEQRIKAVVIEIPLGAEPTGHISRDLRTHLNSQLTQPQSIAVARLTAGLRQTATKLADGRPVLFNADAVRWLLEQIADA